MRSARTDSIFMHNLVFASEIQAAFGISFAYSNKTQYVYINLKYHSQYKSNLAS